MLPVTMAQSFVRRLIDKANEHAQLLKINRPGKECKRVRQVQQRVTELLVSPNGNTASILGGFSERMVSRRHQADIVVFEVSFPARQRRKKNELVLRVPRMTERKSPEFPSDKEDENEEIK